MRLAMTGRGGPRVGGWVWRWDGGQALCETFDLWPLTITATVTFDHQPIGGPVQSRPVIWAFPVRRRRDPAGLGRGRGAVHLGGCWTIDRSVYFEH